GDLTIGDVVILNRHVLGKEDLLEAREYLIALGDYLGAGGSATISVDDATIKPGETFELPVWIEENTGLAGIALSFDVPEGFTLNSITKSNLLSKGSFSVDGNTCTWYAPTNMNADGELITLNLTASENAQSGKVNVGVKDRDGNNFTDEHGASMLVDFAAGSVKVRSTCEINGHTAGKEVHENEKEATCDKDGSYEAVIYCKVCQKEISRETKAIPKVNHAYGDWKTVKEATTEASGLKERLCSICGRKETLEIAKIVANPTDNTAPTNDSAPKGTSLTKVVSGKAKQKRIKVTWKKQKIQTSGYQIQYGLKKNYKGAKILTIKGSNKTSATIKKLKGGKTYYVRIRTFKTSGTQNYVSGWSKSKKVKVK
ncbi:MAG: fibronectin type III domain-containing protein, partial [Anaerobutyricum sp.]|nr:fibronectin type III domain-containing protein [Anaerobutyricum sp.]